MHNSAWVALLKYLPAEKHDRIMLVTRGGTEIAIQGLLRIDREFVAIKGRLSGSQEAGRVFFIPFDQIDYFGFQQPLKDSEFHELFGGLVIPETGAEPAPATELRGPAPDPAEPPTVARVDQEAEVPPQPNSTAAARPEIKSAVLERFRARTSSVYGTPAK